jgi:hypothetical protein
MTNLRQIFHKLFRKTPTLISEEEALLIARDECKKRDWAWLDPVEVQSQRGKWIVRTNRQGRGANARVVIDQNTGTVIDAAYLPR